MSEIKIITWQDRFAQDYISLAIEWLEKNVSVEPGDLEIIHHPYEAVLNGGGSIYFALDGEKAVGTITMIWYSPDTLELAKLAVTESAKGQGIGSLLMQQAIDFAQGQGAQAIILYTNHKLLPAIALYQKYGFKEVSLVNNKYIESDIKMELRL